jgi:hypothetical protein
MRSFLNRAKGIIELLALLKELLANPAALPAFVLFTGLCFPSLLGRKRNEGNLLS